MLSYQFMSITFKSGSDQSLKINRFPRLLCLLTNPRCPFKTCFSPPPACAAITFPLHSAWQPVGVSVWVLWAPLTCLVCSSGERHPTGPTLVGWCPLVGLFFPSFPIPTQFVPQIAEELWIKRFGADIRDHLRRFKVNRHAFHVFHFVS